MAKRTKLEKGVEAWLPSTKPKENRTKLEQIFDKHNADNFWGVNQTFGFPDQLIMSNRSYSAIIKNLAGIE